MYVVLAVLQCEVEDVCVEAEVEIVVDCSNMRLGLIREIGSSRRPRHAFRYPTSLFSSQATQRLSTAKLFQRCGRLPECRRTKRTRRLPSTPACPFQALSNVGPIKL